MTTQVHPLEEPLYKEVSTTTSTEVATTAPAANQVLATPPQRLSAQDLASMGIEGASDVINFFDYPILHLKDRNFIQTSENDADHGTELFIKNISGVTKQWLIRSVNDKGVVVDSSTDLFYTLQPPGTPDHERFNTKNESLAEWKDTRIKEGKKVEPEVKDKGGKDSKMYLMISCALAKPTLILPVDTEIIVQVMPSSANYRWPNFTKPWRAAALRKQMAEGLSPVEALRQTVVRCVAGKKVTETATAFYPLVFEVAA